MTDPQDKLQQRLLLLRRSYVKKIPDKQANLSQLFDAFVQEQSTDTISALRQAVHKLKGSGATYGFDAISDDAKGLELMLVEMLDGKRDVAVDEVKTGLAALDATLQHIADEASV